MKKDKKVMFRNTFVVLILVFVIFGSFSELSFAQDDDDAYELPQDAASALDSINEFNHDGEIEVGVDYEVVYENEQIRVVDTKGFKDLNNEEKSSNPGWEDETLIIRGKATIVAGIYNLTHGTNITAEDVILDESIVQEIGNTTISLPAVSNIETGSNNFNEKSINDLLSEPITLVRLGENFSDSPMEGVIGNNLNPQQFAMISESGDLIIFVFSPTRDEEKGTTNVFNNPNGNEQFHLEDFYELSDAFTKVLRDLGVDAQTAYQMMVNLFGGWIDFTGENNFVKTEQQINAEAQLNQ